MDLHWLNSVDNAGTPDATDRQYEVILRGLKATIVLPKWAAVDATLMAAIIGNYLDRNRHDLNPTDESFCELQLLAWERKAGLLDKAEIEKGDILAKRLAGQFHRGSGLQFNPDTCWEPDITAAVELIDKELLWLTGIVTGMPTFDRQTYEKEKEKLLQEIGRQ